MSTAKPSARFLPTLTEVVQRVPSPSEAPKPSVDPVLDLTQRAQALLEARLAERLESLVQAQAQILLDGLRDEIQLAVADAVKQALREGQ